MKTVWIILGIIVIVLVLLVLGVTGSGMMGFGWGRGMMGNMRSPGLGMMMPLWCLGGPLLWIAIIAGVIWLLTTQLQKRGGAQSGSVGETPLDILKTRYAKGEITKEQFDVMRKDIGA